MISSFSLGFQKCFAMTEVSLSQILFINITRDHLKCHYTTDQPMTYSWFCCCGRSKCWFTISRAVLQSWSNLSTLFHWAYFKKKTILSFFESIIISISWLKTATKILCLPSFLPSFPSHSLALSIFFPFHSLCENKAKRQSMMADMTTITGGLSIFQFQSNVQLAVTAKQWGIFWIIVRGNHSVSQRKPCGWSGIWHSIFFPLLPAVTIPLLLAMIVPLLYWVPSPKSSPVAVETLGGKQWSYCRPMLMLLQAMLE